MAIATITGEYDPQSVDCPDCGSRISICNGWGQVNSCPVCSRETLAPHWDQSDLEYRGTQIARDDSRIIGNRPTDRQGHYFGARDYASAVAEMISRFPDRIVSVELWKRDRRSVNLAR